MMRNLKALILMAMALLAMSAVTASAVSASQFESDAESTTLSATADGTAKNSHHVFDAAGGSITCNSIQFDSVMSGKTASEITVSPTYSGCTFAGQTATVNFHKCYFLFTATSRNVHITGFLCIENPITFSVPSPPCVVTIPPQTIASAVDYTNIKPGSNEEITLDAHATGIEYTATGSGCPTAGTNTNGNYTTGNTIVTGTNTATGTMTNIRWKA